MKWLNVWNSVLDLFLFGLLMIIVLLLFRFRLVMVFLYVMLCDRCSMLFIVLVLVLYGYMCRLFSVGFSIVLWIVMMVFRLVFLFW